MRVPPLENDWAAYQFDNSVLSCGLTIENALHEREPVGDPKKHETRPKYTLLQLLDPDFRLPAPATERTANVFDDFVQQLMGRAGQPGSRGRMWKYVGSGSPLGAGIVQ